MSMENAVTFGIGFLAGYYLLAHYRRTGKFV
jgi:hypothetical protein